MTEIAPEINLRVENEAERPLSPENYRNFEVQRRIMGYLETREPNVLEMDHYPISVDQAIQYNEKLIHGEYDYAAIKGMIELIPGPLDDESSQENYTNLARKLESDEKVRKALRHLGGGEPLVPAYIVRFMESNPTPVDLDGSVEAYLINIERNEGLEVREDHEKSVRDLLDSLYGDKQVYWQNFKYLAEKAFEDASPKEVLKKSTNGRKMAGKLAKVALAGTVLAGGVQFGYGYGSQQVESEHSDSSVARTETNLENVVEEKYGIEILDIREAYKVLGIDFDVYNQDSLGDHPPTRWSEDQIKLLDELLSRLPSRFYSSQVEKLDFTLTDYGKDCPCAGTFHDENPNARPGLVVLSDTNFRQENGDWPFRLLTHELAHRMDLDVLDRSLWPKVTSILGFNSFTEARQNYSPKLDEVAKSIPGLDSIKDKLNYGFNGLGNTGLDDPTEFMATMAEIYVGGNDEFMQIGKFLGKNKAEELYQLMKTEMFDGMEYNSQSRHDQLLIEDIFGVDLVGNESDWTTNELIELRKSFDILPDDFFSPFGQDSELISLRIGIGEYTEVIGLDDVRISRNAFSKVSDVLSELGSALSLRADGYTDSTLEIEKLLGVRDQQEAYLMMQDLVKLYLKGQNTFEHNAGKINKSLKRKEDKSYEKSLNYSVYKVLRDKLFGGREYVINDGSDEVMLRSQAE